MVKTFKHYTDNEIQKNLNLQKEHWEKNFNDYCQLIGVKRKNGDSNVFQSLFGKSLFIRELQLEQTKRVLKKSFTPKLKWMLLKSRIQRLFGRVENDS